MTYDILFDVKIDRAKTYLKKQRRLRKDCKKTIKLWIRINNSAKSIIEILYIK